MGAYVKGGTWKGKEQTFSLHFKFGSWYITVIPKNKLPSFGDDEIRLSETDLYENSSIAKNEKHPPEDKWKVSNNAGIEPPPKCVWRLHSNEKDEE